MSLFQYVETREFEIHNPIFRVASIVDNTNTDIQDIGFFGQYYDGSNVCYTGLFRDANDNGTFKLFSGLQSIPTVSEPNALVDTNGTGYTLADLDIKNIQAMGNAIVDGNLTVNGSYAEFNVSSFNVKDNIIAINSSQSSSLEDFGYVGRREATNISANDTPKIDSVAVQTNYTSGSTTLLITNVASGTDYFKGWVITNTVDGLSSAKTILASTNSGTTHTLTLNSGFSSNLTAGSDTVKLFNKRFAGWIYDESENTMIVAGFPREDSETKIDIVAPVNGNIPDYMNLAVNDLTIAGTLNITGAIPYKTKTVTTNTTFTQSDIFNYDIIFINNASNGTYTLPQISSLAVTTNTSYSTVIVNINTGIATVSRGGTDTIEGETSLRLHKIYMKTVLVVSDQLASTWLIKG